MKRSFIPALAALAITVAGPGGAAAAESHAFDRTVLPIQ